jgi:histidine phosphotransfer protein HptB
MNFKELADRIGLDEEDYRELIELFMETGMADFDQLKSALDAGDGEQVARSAHTISGASGNLGLMDVHEVAKRIELAASEGKLDQVPADAQTLKGFFESLGQFVSA